MTLEWSLQRFSELSPVRLYAIMQLRQAIFVVEQHCVFQDADGLDDRALHLCGYASDQLIVYARLHPSGVARKEAMISRVVTAAQVRRQGYGMTLMARATQELREVEPDALIWLGAQLRLETFYQRFSFKRVSEPYMEDGIWHIGMRAKPAI